MEFLLAVDLEGAHGVIGEPYCGLLPGMAEYEKAVKNVTEEVNAAVDALFGVGATKVYVWDNHGNLDNLDFSKVDARAEKIKPESNSVGRMDFLRNSSVSGVLFIGYHAREGSLGGVLAHTYSSESVQYYKIDGKQVGEFDIDGIIAETFGVSVVFLAGDDVCAAQFSKSYPQALIAVTKIGKGRNAAEFLSWETVSEEIRRNVAKAAQKRIRPDGNRFPCSVEVRYTRTEDAAKALEKLNSSGLRVVYGDDAHIVRGVAQNVNDLRKFL